MRVDLSEAFTKEIREPNWIVKDVIPAGTMVLVAGDAGVGKTVMNLSEALYVALGRRHLDHATTQTRVLYFDEESSRPDLYTYLQQIWLGMGCPAQDDVDNWFRLEHFSLDRNWPSRMREIVAEWQPGMIYIDTATSALKIDKEDDNSEASRVAQQLRYAMQCVTPHAAMKVLKHAKYVNAGGQRKGESKPRRTIRGAKAWLGIVDQVQYHVKDGAGRPRNDGLHGTILVPDKSRAWGLKRHIRIEPTLIDNALTLKGETFTPDRDFMVHE